MKPIKYKPTVFRREDEIDLETKDRLKQELDSAMKPIVHFNHEIKNKFANLQGFITDMIQQNISLMENSCERQVNCYKSQKKRLKGYIDINSSLYENQPEVMSLQTEVENLRLKVAKMNDRASILIDSYENARRIAYERNDIVKLLWKEVRNTQKSVLDRRYQVYSYSTTPQPVNRSDIHKLSCSSQYRPSELGNLPYLIPKHLDCHQRIEYQSHRKTVEILKSQIQAKRREQQTISLNQGTSCISYKTQDFLIDCLISISKSYGMYQNINKAIYNDKMNLLDGAFSITPSYNKPVYISTNEFLSKTPKEILKMIENYPVILKILKLSVSSIELSRRNDLPYSTSESPIDCRKEYLNR